MNEVISVATKLDSRNTSNVQPKIEQNDAPHRDWVSKLGEAQSLGRQYPLRTKLRTVLTYAQSSLSGNSPPSPISSPDII